MQFGLERAKSGQERFWVIYNTHIAALQKGLNVDYGRIDTIQIEIPKNAETIPLPEHTNFGNAVIVVKNKTKNYTLFSLHNALENYTTNIDCIEKKRKVQEDGEFIVIIEDEKPWVENRRGYSYGHMRKDIVYVNNGKVNGSLVASYMTEESKPKFSRSFVTGSPKCIQNLTVIRDSLSTYKTFIFKIENQYNVKFNNLTIFTPPNIWYGDVAVKIDNCYKVHIENTTINGTYSEVDNYGYGISMNNVQDVSIKNLKARAEWGIFGNNNVNNVRLDDSDINRFDVHCYGKDVKFEKCTFRDLYNQFSSMYGTISFKNCRFIDFTPVLFESSYNAYTKFDLRFKNCTVEAGEKRRYLISGGGLNGDKTKNRKELSQQEYPNLYIDGLKVYMPDNVDSYSIYNFNRRILQWPKDSIPGIKRIRKFELIPSKKLLVSNMNTLVEIPQKWKFPLTITGGGGIMMVCGGFFFFKKRKRKCEKVKKNLE